MKVTKPRKVTYLGRRAELWEERLAGPSGERTIFVRWIDDADERNGGYPAGTVTARRVTGDFMRGTGKTLVDTHVVNPA